MVRTRQKPDPSRLNQGEAEPGTGEESVCNQE